MFLPHTYNPESGEFRPILDGVKSSRFYQTLGLAQRSAEEQYSDSWDKYFIRVKMLRENGIDITKECSRMCNIMMTRDAKMREMVKKNFTPEDYFAVRDHMVGTGMIGGKSCGMLLARAIIRNKEPDISEVLEPHDSFYVGSDIGKINWHYRDMDKHMMLIVPGRVGTTSPELGVPTSFADISAYDIICETEESRAGYNPELSYGSHIFQDLVEAEILYTAIFQGEKTKKYSPEKLTSSKDLINELNYSDVLEGVVHIYDVSDRKCEVYNDVAKEHLLITYSGIETE